MECAIGRGHIKLAFMLILSLLAAEAKGLSRMGGTGRWFPERPKYLSPLRVVARGRDTDGRKRIGQGRVVEGGTGGKAEWRSGMAWHAIGVWPVPSISPKGNGRWPVPRLVGTEGAT